MGGELLLLAGCSGSGGSVPIPGEITPPDPVEEASTTEEDPQQVQLEQAVLAIESAPPAVSSDAEGSPIILHMRADQTPPDGWNTPPVTDIAIRLVADFINQLPAESHESASGR